MKIEDRPAIAAHVAAKVSSDEFRPSIEAAYEVIRGIQEYQDVAALLMYKLNVQVSDPDAILSLTVRDVAKLALTGLACGFAFGADFGENRFAEALVIGGKE